MPPVRNDMVVFLYVKGIYMENEIKEQIERCKALQQQCRIQDTEIFLKLSRRITDLASLLECSQTKEKEIPGFKVIEEDNIM